MGGDKAITSAEAKSALLWWLDAGVDVAVGEAPRDWLKPAPSAPAPAPTFTQPKGASATLGEMPATLGLFRDWLGAAPALPFASAGARRILPHGAEGAPVMLLAEMPGLEDAAAGQPIGGDAWSLMQRMLAAIGIDSAEAYSASLSCFHAPASRNARDELAACAAIARRHVALVRPKRLLLLGDAPSKAMLGKPLAVARGHVHQVEGVRTVATFHPRQLIERSSHKPLAWHDLLLLMEEEA